MFLIVVFLASLLTFVIVTAGASWAMWYYRRRFEQSEKKAAIVIGASLALLLPSMYVAENLLPGRPGEIAATGTMVAICVIAIRIVWQILTLPRRNV
jgi:hypothetical protein